MAKIPKAPGVPLILPYVTPPPPPLGKKKWAPAIPMHGGLFPYGLAGVGEYSNRLAQYNNDIAFGLPTNFAYLYAGKWIEFEPSYNSYSIASIIQDIQLLASKGIYFAFKVSTYGAGNPPTGTIPDYLYDPANANYLSGYGVGYYGSKAGQSSPTDPNASMWRAAYFQPAICQRYVALHQVLANYPITVGGQNYTLDTLPWLIAVSIDEETQPSGGAVTINNQGWGWSQLNTERLQWDEGWRTIIIPGVGAAWPHTNVMIPFNWLSQSGAASAAYVNSFMNSIAQAQCAIQPPDTLPTITTTIGGTVYAGTTGVAAYSGQLPSATDYRNSIPFMPLIEQPDIPNNNPSGSNFYNGPPCSGSPASQAVNWIDAYNVLGAPAAPSNGLTGLHAAIQWWSIETGAAGILGANWYNDVLPTLKTHPIPASPNGIYPSGYP